MNKIQVSMVDSSFYPIYYSSERDLELHYSCKEHHECSSMTFSLPKGRYLIECYGAGGGSWHSDGSTTLVENKDLTRSCPEQNNISFFNGNTKCNPNNNAGSGAYMSGFLTVTQTTRFYAGIGGSGTYLKSSTPKGGYNGGGKGGSYSSGCSSGGGGTDLRVVADDYFHRIIVAGGGGGSEDSNYDASSFYNDGAGGAGGYPEAQGYWISGVYTGSKVANQTNGFSFGQGEATTISNDACGAAGGWFGGFASQHNNGGCGGGSSFILKKDAKIPSGQLTQKTEAGVVVATESYAFLSKTKYLFDNVKYANGVWSGDGMMRITFIGKYKLCTRSIRRYNTFYAIIIILTC